MVKAKTTAKYTQKLLKTCKSWGGPLTNREMLQQILKNSGDHQDKIVRTKLLYYWDTHKSEIMNTQDLFKLNKISHEDWLINLCVTQRNAIRGWYRLFSSLVYQFWVCPNSILNKIITISERHFNFLNISVT